MPDRCGDCLVAIEFREDMEACGTCGRDVCRWCWPSHAHCADCGVPVGLEPCRCPTCREPFCQTCTVGPTCPQCDPCFERKRADRAIERALIEKVVPAAVDYCNKPRGWGGTA